MILRIIGIFLFIWFGGLPGGTRPTGLRQQPVLRLFCCFGGICRPPVSIFEAFRPKRYYFMHNYPFFDILSLQARKKTAARSFYSLAEAVGFEPTCPCGQPHFESSGKNRTWRNLTEDNSRWKNPENAVFSRLFASLWIENKVKIRVRESPPISPSSNGFSGKSIRIFDRTERFFAPKSRFWQCVKSTGYAEPHQKSCRQMPVQNQNFHYRQKYEKNRFLPIVFCR